jgi:hypothetical protein
MMTTLEEYLLFVSRVVLEMTQFVSETEFVVVIVVSCSKVLSKSTKGKSECDLELVLVLVLVLGLVVVGAVVMMHEMGVFAVEMLVLCDEAF